MSIIKYKKISVIGSGFVGQATGKGLAKMGHSVVFYDIKPEVINSLNESGYTARHIDALDDAVKDEVDIFMLSVPTPTINRKIELKHLRTAVKEVGKTIGKMKNVPVVVVRSTVPPGTTENLVVPIIEKASGKKVEQGFGVSMQPEFLREVSAEKDFMNPWIVVIGSEDKMVGMMLEKIYEAFGAPIFQMSLKEAEMMKYAHNLLNATKISFFNEMRLVGEEIGADPDVIFPAVVKSAEAMWNPLYGTKNFGAYGGSCLPKDTEAFYTWAMENFNFKMPVLKGTMQTNELMQAISNKTQSGSSEEKSRFTDLLPAMKRVFSHREFSQKSWNRAGYRQKNIKTIPLKNL